MNETLIKIFNSREDISSYLFHFTKGSKALDTLYEIICTESLLDLEATGVICFTEAPITLLTDMFKIFEKFKDPLFSPYGIAIKKEIIFALGGRPVIYSLEEEKIKFDESVHWRFEKYIPNVRDYSWLREWRVQTNKIKLTHENCFIITKSKSELSVAYDETDIGDIEFDGSIEDGEPHSYAYAPISRKFKGVSLEEIDEFNNPSKVKLDSLISNQNFDDKIDICLGSL